MSAIDWSTIFNQYKGLWVALADDEETVLASGETAKDVKYKAEKNGHPNPILMKLPDKLMTYIGYGL